MSHRHNPRRKMLKTYRLQMKQMAPLLLAQILPKKRKIINQLIKDLKALFRQILNSDLMCKALHWQPILKT